MTKIWNRRQEDAARRWDDGHDNLAAKVAGLRDVVRRMDELSVEINAQGPALNTYRSHQAIHGLHFTYTDELSGLSTVLSEGATMVKAADQGQPVSGWIDGKMNAVITPIRARQLASHFEQSKYTRLMRHPLGRPSGFMAGHGYLDTEVLQVQPGQSPEEQSFLRGFSRAYSALDERRQQLDDGREPTNRRAGKFVSLENGRAYALAVVTFYERAAELTEEFALSCRAVTKRIENAEVPDTPTPVSVPGTLTHSSPTVADGGQGGSATARTGSLEL